MASPASSQPLRPKACLSPASDDRFPRARGGRTGVPDVAERVRRCGENGWAFGESWCIRQVVVVMPAHVWRGPCIIEDCVSNFSSP